MAGQAIEIPNFDFSGFYYPQLLEALLAFKRINVPELTDESDKEPSIQLLRAYALVGHLNNVLIDLVANESTLPTAQLPETIRNMLRLIGYDLKPALPASVDMVYKLSKVFPTPFVLVPPAARAATLASTGDVPIIYFEALGGITLARTDKLGAVFLYDASLDSYTDSTTAANAGTNFDATLSGAQLDAQGDALYFGHANVMFDTLRVAAGSGPIAISPAMVTQGVWEYYDVSDVSARPDSVSVVGNTIRLNINGFIGPANRSGAVIQVIFNKTGASRDLVSTWDGTNNYVITEDLMGQSMPSSVASDYSVGSNWQELDNVLDGTANLGGAGDVTFTLPQTLTQNWGVSTVNGFSGFFIRLRAIVSTAGTSHILGLIRIDAGAQYALANATQGQSVTAETLGSSNGEPNQAFVTQQNGFILGSQQVRVNGEVWNPVTNFLNSAGLDKVYQINLGENDAATIQFGDGVTSKIPDIGQGNLVIDYRYGANDPGNVGANYVTVDKQGLTYVQKIYNPRSASGWVASEASDDLALERAKIAGPASLSVKEVALSSQDLSDLSTSFTSSNGSKPFSRAKAIEEGFGPKTVEVVCVVHGGSIATPTQLSEFSTYCNGDNTVSPPLKKHFIANQQAVPTSFTPHPIDVDAIVWCPSDITVEQIQNELAAVLQPESVKEDGVTYTWDFGGLVPASRISHEIFRVDARISRVQLNVPAADIQLGGRELPTSGVFTIQIIST